MTAPADDPLLPSEEEAYQLAKRLGPWFWGTKHPVDFCTRCHRRLQKDGWTLYCPHCRRSNS